MQDDKPIDPSTGEPIPNPKPDPNLPDDWPPKLHPIGGVEGFLKTPHPERAFRTSKLMNETHLKNIPTSTL